MQGLADGVYQLRLQKILLSPFYPNIFCLEILEIFFVYVSIIYSCPSTTLFVFHVLLQFTKNKSNVSVKSHLRQGDSSGKKPLRMVKLKDHSMSLICCVHGRRHNQLLPVCQSRSPVQGLSSCHPGEYSATKQVGHLNHWL